MTGAGGGLGSEVVLRLREEYRLLTPSRHDLDVTSEASARAFFASQRDLYALVHLVGGWSGGRVEETTSEQWQQMLDVNVTSAFVTMREAARVMTRPGRIIAISSIASLEVTSGSAAYTVAKSALNTLVHVLAADLRGSGITVNAVAPTGIATKAMLSGGADAATLVSPDVIAETLAFFLSDAAATISGTILPMRP